MVPGKKKAMVAQGGEDFEKMGKSMDNGQEISSPKLVLRARRQVNYDMCPQGDSIKPLHLILLEVNYGKGM